MTLPPGCSITFPSHFIVTTLPGHSRYGDGRDQPSPSGHREDPLGVVGLSSPVDACEPARYCSAAALAPDLPAGYIKCSHMKHV